MLLEFKSLRIGETFLSGGNVYQKQSTRTAGLVLPERFADGKRWYFEHNEVVRSGTNVRGRTDV